MWPHRDGKHRRRRRWRWRAIERKTSALLSELLASVQGVGCITDDVLIANVVRRGVMIRSIVRRFTSGIVVVAVVVRHRVECGQIQGQSGGHRQAVAHQLTGSFAKFLLFTNESSKTIDEPIDSQDAG